MDGFVKKIGEFFKSLRRYPDEGWMIWDMFGLRSLGLFGVLAGFAYKWKVKALYLRIALVAVVIIFPTVISILMVVGYFAMAILVPKD